MLLVQCKAFMGLLIIVKNVIHHIIIKKKIIVLIIPVNNNNIERIRWSERERYIDICACARLDDGIDGKLG